MSDRTRVLLIDNKGFHAKLVRDYLKTLPCELVLVRDESWSSPAGVFYNREFEQDYDIGINFLGTVKIPADEVKRPRLGWANFHPAPLPEFGGRNLAYHAIATGAKMFGASVHYMDEGYDTGPLIEVQRFPILPHHTAHDLYRKSVELLCEMAFDALPDLLRGRLLSTPQDKEKQRYFRKTELDDVVEVTEERGRLIRALTFPPTHYAKIVVGGRTYKIVPEDSQ